MGDVAGRYQYKMINDKLERVLRTGTLFSKDAYGGDLVLSLEQLREVLCPPLVDDDSSLEADDIVADDDDQQVKKREEREESCKFLDSARALPPVDERRILISEIFHRNRQFLYECQNEDRRFLGKQPWYIMAREEVAKVGFVLPYSLVTHPDHKFIKQVIEMEARRLDECEAAGTQVKAWSGSEKRNRDARGGAGSKSENLGCISSV